MTEPAEPASTYLLAHPSGSACERDGRPEVYLDRADAETVRVRLDEPGPERCYFGPHRVVEYRSVSAHTPWRVIHQDGGVCSAGGLLEIPFTDELAARRTAAMLDRQPVDGPLPSCPRRPHGVRPVEDPR